MKEVSFRVRNEMENQKTSKIARYCDLVIGQRSLWALIKYELIILISSIMPGALGLFLRSKLFPLILKKCGKNVVFGSHIVFRHPGKIEIGDNVIIDDNCMLDAKGTDNKGIQISDGVFLGRNSILSSKNGDIYLGKNVNIGFNSYIFSGSQVYLGDNTLVAAYCYFIGGDHGSKEVDTIFYDQECSSHGIHIGENCWFGAGVKVQDKVTIGSNSVTGTSAVVTKNIPEYSVAVGIPARVVRDRRNLNSDE